MAMAATFREPSNLARGTGHGQSRGYRLADLTVGDLTAELDAAYPDLNLGLVDASVIALSERLGETKVATLDRRDFSVVRPRHCDALRLLPD